ncbi:MAG: ATP-binding cassette domain-containing protein, partial [Peptostreptococcaceae bacterium]
MSEKKRKRSTWEALMWSNQFAWQANKIAYIWLVIFSLLISLNTYIGLSFTEYVVNSAYYLVNNEVKIIRVIVTIMSYTVILIIFQVLKLLIDNLKERLKLDISRDFHGQLNNKLARICWEYYENHETFSKIDEVRQNSLATIIDMVDNSISYILLIPTSMIYIYYLLQINIVVIPFYILLVIVFNLKIAGKMFTQIGEYWKEVQPYTRKQNYFFNMCGDRISHQEYRFLRLFNLSSLLWEENFESEFKIKIKIFKKHEITLQTARLIFNIPYIMMMIFIGFEIMQNKHEIGYLIMANSLLNQIIDTCLQTQNSISTNRIKYIFIHTLNDVMNFKEEPTNTFSRNFNSIELKDISYTYPQSAKKALDNFNLSIKKGEKLAIVGVNGSGKTTFTNILSGLIYDYQGSIYDGEELIVLKHFVSCINQDFAQYQMTIKENIAAGNPEKDFTDEEITKLINKVGLGKIIDTLPQGIHTYLGQL